MCGAFFSLMPFPPRQLHTLSHVRYTPSYYWQDRGDLSNINHELNFQIAQQTSYPYMIKDVVRYLPILQECTYVDSLREIKTILPQSEIDDSRPILFQRNHGLTNLICVLGGKIDNVYDIPKELEFLQREKIIV
jgi:hypothetical protein